MSGGRPTVFIHVGLQKTGTTYLQGIMQANRPALRRAGLLYPGTRLAHFWPSQDLRGIAFQGSVDRRIPGAWQRLVKEVRAWPARSLIDHESLAAASPTVIARALDDLSFADVHVVVTVRDLARQLPSEWQEGLKNGGTRTFRAFLAGVQGAAERRRSTRAFWAHQDVPEILGRWGRDLEPERVHVVTVPPPGADPTLLWRRFAALLGLDPDAYDCRPREANTALAAAEAAVLRRFNTLIRAHEVPWPVRDRIIKRGLAPALAARGGVPIELPEPAFAWAVQWSRQAIERLDRAGYDVVGDLGELVPATRPIGGDPDGPADEAQLDAAAAAMVILALATAQSRDAQSALRRGQRGPVARKLEGASARVPVVAAMREALRRQPG